MALSAAHINAASLTGCVVPFFAGSPMAKSHRSSGPETAGMRKQVTQQRT